MLGKCLVDINVLVYFWCVGMHIDYVNKERALGCCVNVVVHDDKL